MIATNVPPFPDSPPAFQWIPTRALEEELQSRYDKLRRTWPTTVQRPFTAEDFHR